MMYLKDDNLFQIKKKKGAVGQLDNTVRDKWSILPKAIFLLFYSRKLSGFLMLKIYGTVNNDELNM